MLQLVNTVKAFGNQFKSAQGPTPGQSSSVETAALRMSLESLGRTPDRPLATEELEAVRQRLAEHAAAWAVLPVGESLVLRFP